MDIAKILNYGEFRLIKSHNQTRLYRMDNDDITLTCTGDDGLQEE